MRKNVFAQPKKLIIVEGNTKYASEEVEREASLNKDKIVTY